jgi:hypothetical protein
MWPMLVLACGTKADPCPETIALTDAQNYAFQGTLDLPSLVTASASDVEICWDGVSADIQCHDLDPAEDVDNVGLVRFSSLTQDEVERGLSQDDLDQAAMSGYVESNNDSAATCTDLASFSFFGTAIDVPAEYTEDGGTYLLLLTTGTVSGMGARVLAFLQPDATSDVTTADVPDGCGALDFSADTTSLEPARTCAAGGSAVDWSAVATDGNGRAFDSSVIDGLMLGFYEGWSAQDVEDHVLDLEIDATRIWRLDLTGGTSADLALATDADGAAFDGFTGDGAWVLALTCSRCYNPAPPFLTLLAPE